MRIGTILKLAALALQACCWLVVRPTTAPVTTGSITRHRNTAAARSTSTRRSTPTGRWTTSITAITTIPIQSSCTATTPGITPIPAGITATDRVRATSVTFGHFHYPWYRLGNRYVGGYRSWQYGHWRYDSGAHERFDNRNRVRQIDARLRELETRRSLSIRSQRPDRQLTPRTAPWMPATRPRATAIRRNEPSAPTGQRPVGSSPPRSSRQRSAEREPARAPTRSRPPQSRPRSDRRERRERH